MQYEYFIKEISQYLDLNNYKTVFKKSRYKGENELWLYNKNDVGEHKRMLTGYTLESNGKTYRTLPAMKKDFISGVANYYCKNYEIRRVKIGTVITEEIINDKEYLKTYLTI